VILRLLVGMSRRLRFIPDPGALVEVTCRALHSRFLLRPGPGLNPIILGALARAKRLYPVRICAFAFASNHFHLILEVDDARQLARFMNHLNSKLAREIGRLTGWREKVLGRRYQAILISSEAEAQTARLKYVLSHGCKEGLVERLQDWPGVHCVQALMEGKTLEGWWFDRTQEYLARRRGKTLAVSSMRPAKPWSSIRFPAGSTSRRSSDSNRPPRWCRRSRGKPPPIESAPESRPSDPPPSWAKIPRASPARPRGPPRRPSMPLRAGQRDAPFPVGCFPPPLPFVGG
jgi:hypothetical protein